MGINAKNGEKQEKRENAHHEKKGMANNDKYNRKIQKMKMTKTLIKEKKEGKDGKSEWGKKRDNTHR